MFDNYAQHVQLFSFDNYKYYKFFDANPYYCKHTESKHISTQDDKLCYMIVR